MADVDADDGEENVIEAAVNTPDVDYAEPDQCVELRFSPELRGLFNFVNNPDIITEKGDKSTNVINNRYKRTYCIPDTSIEEFFILYEACRSAGKVLNYAERQETSAIMHTGIMIDLDIYQHAPGAIVTTDHITRIVYNIANIIYATLNFPAEDYFSYNVFVIRKPAIKAAPEHNCYKDGLHILIPEIQITKATKLYIHAEMVRLKILANVFANIMDRLLDVDTILDKGATRSPVNFFGSVKPSKPQPPAYVLSHAYKVNIQLFPHHMITTENLPTELISSGQSPDYLPINTAYELSLGFALQSIDGQVTWLAKQPFECRPELEDKIRVAYERHDLPAEEIEDADADVDILTLGNAEAAYLQKLLDILDISYATDYTKWIKVIFAIANTSPRYKPLAVAFSQRAPESYSESSIERVWAEGLTRTGGPPLTKRSIIYWARMSSPERFKELDRTNYVGILATALYQNKGKISHADIARVMYAMIGNKFVSDIPKNDPKCKDREWYEFILPEQKHKLGEVFKWRHEYSPDNLHNFIADHIPKLFDEIIQQMTDRRDAADSPELQKYWKNVIGKTEDSRLKMGDNLFQVNALKQGHHRFRVRGFTDELDADPLVLGVGNGVLKLGAQPTLIQGFHEYKVSKYTTTNYVPYDPDNPYIQEIEQMTRDIYTEPDAHEYMMFFLCTWLDGKEAVGIMINVDGSGCNGKTSVAKLVHNALGNQYILLGRATLLTDLNDKAQGANEAHIAMEDKRGAYFDEFKAGAELNMARIKAIVNPGWQTGRGIYGKEHNFRNTCNPMTLSNYRLVVKETDHGTWRRLKSYTCKTRFEYNPNPAKPHERQRRDECALDWPNDPRYLEAMLSIIVNYHQRLTVEYGGKLETVVSPTIEYETEQFRNQQDSVNKFILQMIVISPDSEPITLMSIADRYLRWSGNERPKQPEIEATMELFKNSRLSDRVEPRDDNVEFVINVRMKLAIGDELLPDESSFAVAHPEEEEEFDYILADCVDESASGDDEDGDEIADENSANAKEVKAEKKAAAERVIRRKTNPKPIARTEKDIEQLRKINAAMALLL